MILRLKRLARWMSRVSELKYLRSGWRSRLSNGRNISRLSSARRSPPALQFAFKSGCWLHLQAQCVASSFQSNSGLTKQPKKHLGQSEQQSATDLLSTHNVCLLTLLFRAILSSKKNLVWGWCVLFWLSEVYDSLFSCILLMESATEVVKCITGICVNRVAERRWCCAVYLGKIVIFQNVIFEHSSGCTRQSLLKCCCLYTAGQESTVCNADEMRWPN